MNWILWTLTANVDIRFGQYDYGGLFLRMPYCNERGGKVLTSEGLTFPEAEGQRARWVAVWMPIEGEENGGGIAILDHEQNPEHPVPWRVDGQLGISPSRCIVSAWNLAEVHRRPTITESLLFLMKSIPRSCRGAGSISMGSDYDTDRRGK